MLKKIGIIILLFKVFACFAQVHEIDSVKKLLSKSLPDSILVNYYLELDNLYSTVNPDSSLYYGNKSIEIAVKNNKAVLLYRAYILNGVAFYKLSKYNQSDSLLQLGYKLAKENNDQKACANANMNLGLVYTNQSRYLDALECDNIALEIYKSLNDSASIAATNVNIGIIYYYQQNIEKALQYHLNALKTLNENEIYNARRLANINQNIGAFYSLLKKNDSALIYTKKALTMHEKLGNLKGMAICYNNLGEFEGLNKKWEKALEYFTKSRQIKIKIKDTRGIPITNNNIAEALIFTKRYSKALPYLNDAINKATSINDFSSLPSTYEKLAIVYDSLKNYKKAYHYFIKFHEFYDTLQQNATDKKLLDLQTQYETEQKEQQIELLKKEKLLQDIKITKNKTINLLLYSSISLLIIFILFLYRSLQTRRKNNQILKNKNNQLNLQKSEIEYQRDEITTQKTALIDSINYAQRIQQALLPLKAQFNQHFTQNFILYLPKDIISGDFYWIKTKGNHIYFAVADCTGHGVPGALMSMLGISLLNEIIGNNDNLKPADILEELREKIKSNLKQTGERDFNRDGMDIALCRFNKEKNQLLYSGANNAAIIIKNHEIIELKPNHNPIGIYVKEKPFTNQIIEINEGNMLYLYSDGYCDQKDANNLYRISSAGFKKLLLDIYPLNINEQHNKLKYYFENWKKDTIQIDDVTVMGIKF